VIKYIPVPVNKSSLIAGKFIGLCRELHKAIMLSSTSR